MTDVLALLGALVAVDTTSGNRQAQDELQSMVSSVVRKEGTRVEVLRSGPEALPWTLIHTGPSGPHLLFACHVDTVPVGDEAAWGASPFAAVVSDGKVYGRGTADMKGGIAAAVEGLLEGARHGKPVALLLTSDEELGSHGAPHAMAALATIDVGAVIIPEATDNEIVTCHRGALWLEVTASGRAAHGSTPERGDNAALKLISVLNRVNEDLPLSKDDDLGQETWNLGTVQAGTAPNVVPDTAHAVVDMRTVGNGHKLESWWRAQPELAAVTTLLRLSALKTDRTHPWLRSLPGPLADAATPYFTDGSVLRSALPDVPIVVWGPGSSTQMHALNEHLPLTSLATAIDCFRLCARTWEPAPHDA